MSLIFEALQKLERRRSATDLRPPPEGAELYLLTERRAAPQWDTASNGSNGEGILSDSAEPFGLSRPTPPSPTRVIPAPAGRALGSLSAPVPAPSTFATPSFITPGFITPSFATPSFATPGPAAPGPILASPVAPSPAEPSPDLVSPVVASPAEPEPVIASLAAPSPAAPSSIFASPAVPSPIELGPVVESNAAPSPIVPSPIFASPAIPSPVEPGPVFESKAAPDPIMPSPIFASPTAPSPVEPGPVFEGKAVLDPIAPSPVLTIQAAPDPIEPDPFAPSPTLASPAPHSPVASSPVIASPVEDWPPYEPPSAAHRAEVAIPAPKIAPPAAPPLPAIDLTPIKSRLAGIKIQQSEIHELLVERGASFNHVEDRLENVHHASTRNTRGQHELIQELRAIGKKINFCAIAALVLVALSVVTTFGLYLRILKVLP
jgi:hypothetical protein